MPDVSPAETIRRAAKLMHDRARHAVPGPWHIGNAVDPTRPCNVHTFPDAIGVADNVSWLDAEHIAALHPVVAHAVADAWEATAAAMDDTTLVREAELQNDLGDWRPVVVSGRTAIRHHDWTATLAAARAYLGGAT